MENTKRISSTCSKQLISDVCIGGEQAHQTISKSGICPCLVSSMGTGGGYVPLLVLIKEGGDFTVKKNSYKSF